jgi:hypothetical protein
MLKISNVIPQIQDQRQNEWRWEWNFYNQTYLGKNTALKTTHVEQQIWIVLGVDTDKAVFPLDSSRGTWKSVLDVPENSTATDRKKPVQNITFHAKRVLLQN